MTKKQKQFEQILMKKCLHLLTFLLLNIALLIAVSTNWYLIEYQPKSSIYYHFTTQIINQEKFHIDKYIIKMESNDKLREIDIKNRKCCYFDRITKTEDFDPDNISIDKKSYENILVYNVS